MQLSLRTGFSCSHKVQVIKRRLTIYFRRTNMHHKVRLKCKGYLVFSETVLPPLSGRSSPWWWRQQALVERQLMSTRLHGATTQRTATFKLAVGISWSLKLRVCVGWECFHRNVGNHVQDNMASQPARSRSASSSPWEHQNSDKEAHYFVIFSNQCLLFSSKCFPKHCSERS
jgi:hypothetical protein